MRTLHRTAGSALVALGILASASPAALAGPVQWTVEGSFALWGGISHTLSFTLDVPGGLGGACVGCEVLALSYTNSAGASADLSDLLSQPPAPGDPLEVMQVQGAVLLGEMYWLDDQGHGWGFVETDTTDKMWAFAECAADDCSTTRATATLSNSLLSVAALPQSNVAAQFAEGIGSVPEPASFAMAGLGLVVLGCSRRRRRPVSRAA